MNEPGKSSQAAFIFTFVVVSCAVVGYFVGLQSPMNPGERRTTGYASPIHPSHGADSAASGDSGTTSDFVVSAADYSEMADITAERARQWKTRLTDLKSDVDLLAEFTITPEEKMVALAKRDANRAFNGAPPTIPHPVNEMPSQACAVCHTEGARTASLRISAMSHPFYTSCTQCHVEAPKIDSAQFVSLVSNELWEGNGFDGLPAPTEGKRAFEGAPPQIPHSVWMRQNCSSCHGVNGLQGIRATHPWRQNCQQCHVGQSSTNQELVSEPKFLPPPKINQ